MFDEVLYMSVFVKELHLKNFKAYGNTEQMIDTSVINLFMGANSSGKSTCLQSLLAIKQTLESKQSDVDILLNGKYAASVIGG